jgi:putative ABC transport system ATP-binding protein
MNSSSVTSSEKQAIVATDLTKWFGEGETKVTAVNRVALVAHFQRVK